MKTRNFSRFWVALFALVLWQSSLGTKAAQINYQSLGQNGYRKYEDGFLIQWGFESDQQTYYLQTVYLPISFLNSSYVVIPGARSSFKDYYVGRTVVSLNVSSFVVSVNQANHEPFYWIAIGRWK